MMYTNQAGKKSCKIWILKNSSTSNTFEALILKADLGKWKWNTQFLLTCYLKLCIGCNENESAVVVSECILALFFTRPVFTSCNLAACYIMRIGYKQWEWFFFFRNYCYFWRKLKLLNWSLSDGRWHLSLGLGLSEESSDFTWLNWSIGGFCCTWNRHKLLMSFPGLINTRVWSRKSFEDVGKMICLTWTVGIIFIMSCCSRHL